MLLRIKSCLLLICHQNAKGSGEILVLVWTVSAIQYLVHQRGEACIIIIIIIIMIRFNFINADDKIYIFNKFGKPLHQSCIILTDQGSDCKQCRFIWGSSLSTLISNSLFSFHFQCLSVNSTLFAEPVVSQWCGSLLGTLIQHPTCKWLPVMLTGHNRAFTAYQIVWMVLISPIKPCTD